jgi:hypothetical protein
MNNVGKPALYGLTRCWYIFYRKSPSVGAGSAKNLHIK